MNNKTVAVILAQSKNSDFLKLQSFVDDINWSNVSIMLGLAAGFVTWLISQSKQQKTDAEATQQRREELKWRRTTFIFEQKKWFTSDKYMSNAANIIISQDAGECDLKKILGYEDSTTGYTENLNDIYKLFSFLDSFACSVFTGVMTFEEVTTFAWYYVQCSIVPELRQPCEDYYPPILKIAKQIKFIAIHFQVKEILDELKKILKEDKLSKLNEQFDKNALHQIDEILEIEKWNFTALNQLKQKLNIIKLNQIKEVFNRERFNQLKKKLNIESLEELEKKLIEETLNYLNEELNLDTINQKLNEKTLNRLETLLNRPYILNQPKIGKT
ncbi:MAG: hypothetical protein AAFQ91_18230 [Cyanobacteria bacterium J06621_15]